MRRRTRRRVGGLGALLLLLVVPGVAPSAVCELSGVGDWGPIDSWTGSDDCGGVLTADDDYVITGSATSSPVDVTPSRYLRPENASSSGSTR